ncbi:MAG: site-specific integrase, partial [Chloroflexota bacterium]|nr:site-specific integrase [Chloroflexota bacterium]
IARTKAVIRRALNVALERGELHRNVATLAAVPTPKRNSRLQPLTVEQAKALIAAAAGTQYEALLSVAVYCGLRESEILGLTHDCVDYTTGIMTVKQQLGFVEASTSKRTIVRKLKSDASHRVFPIPAPCLDALRANKTRQAEQQLAAVIWESRQLVFCTRNGRPLGPRNVVRAFKRYLRESGGPDVPFHMLRHGTATYLADAGVPIRTAMEMLGHSQMTTLVHIYQSATSDMKQAAAQRLSAMFA